MNRMVFLFVLALLSVRPVTAQKLTIEPGETYTAKGVRVSVAARWSPPEAYMAYEWYDTLIRHQGRAVIIRVLPSEFKASTLRTRKGGGYLLRPTYSMSDESMLVFPAEASSQGWLRSKRDEMKGRGKYRGFMEWRMLMALNPDLVGPGKAVDWSADFPATRRFIVADLIARHRKDITVLADGPENTLNLKGPEGLNPHYLVALLSSSGASGFLQGGGRTGGYEYLQLLGYDNVRYNKHLHPQRVYEIPALVYVDAWAADGMDDYIRDGLLIHGGPVNIYWSLHTWDQFSESMKGPTDLSSRRLPDPVNAVYIGLFERQFETESSAVIFPRTEK